MKKILFTLLLVFALSAPLAADGGIALGVSSGFNQLISVSDYAMNMIALKLDAMFYFGSRFALNTALGVDFYLGDDALGLDADLLAYYRLSLEGNMDLFLGGGLSYKSLWFLLNYLSLLASIRFNFGITENIDLFVAGETGYNLWSGFLDETIDENIIPWALKAGLSYRF